MVHARMNVISGKKVSEYYQEIPQSHTAYHPQPLHRTFTVRRHLSDNKSKATSSLFLFNTIAKLERTQSNAIKKMTNTEIPQPMGSTANNRSTTAEPPP